MTTARDAEFEMTCWLNSRRIGHLEVVVHRPAGASRSVEDIPIEAMNTHRLFYPIPTEEVGS